MLMVQQLQTRKTQHPYKPRASLQPGAVLILLAGRFRGKRVVLLKTLDQGVLLVTGPFKVNGVPLRRVNARYVIATRTTVPINGLDSKTLEKVSDSNYFARDKKADKKGSEEAFFQQGERWLELVLGGEQARLHDDGRHEIRLRGTRFVGSSLGLGQVPLRGECRGHAGLEVGSGHRVRQFGF